MKKSILAVFAVSATLALLACSGSSNSTDEEQIATFKTKPLTFTDERDGKTYRYVKIGTQAWMAENLNYAVPLTVEAGSTAIDAEVGSVCYDNKESNCDKYGRLYYWTTAMGLPADCKGKPCPTPKGTQRQGVCPAGWHLPDSSEWGTLLNYVGIKAGQVYGNKLATKLMSESIGGTDKYGFNALLSGMYNNGRGRFFGIDTLGKWWTTSIYTGVYTPTISENGQMRFSQTLTNLPYLYSVRCVQDDPSLPLITATSSSSVKETPSSSSATPKPTFANTFTDERDGKKYGYVEIGEQTWMAENLNYAVDFSEIGGNKYDSKCYMNDESNCDIYGRLYTWGAAINSLCPSDWHLPSDAEWAKLTNFAGKSAATKLKSKIGWDSSGNGTDAYGFAALPSGIGVGGAGVGFEMIGTGTFFWTSTEDDYFHQSVFSHRMYYSSDTVERRESNKSSYFSVRCVKDVAKSSSSSAVKTPSSSSAVLSTVVENGVVKTLFTDERDGKIYKSVKIGKQTWMAENLNYAAEGRMCYEDCTVYGGIYDWATAMDLLNTYNTLSYTASAKHQGICPAGWHIPSDAEWTTLANFVGDNAGIRLKAKSGWNSNNGISGNGNDMYGFAALPGGYAAGRNLNNQGYYGYWLSATEYAVETTGGQHAYSRKMSYDKDDFFQDAHIKNYYAYSVRCVKDTEE
ncbi:MAG: hypothetical protein LBC87_03850 [Fibromonadaceae bacterium]|nr:hypothetical protein [Fibromonadaceae bacterium]